MPGRKSDVQDCQWLQRLMSQGDAALAIGDIADYLSEAYKDNWQDRELYEHYKR